MQSQTGAVQQSRDKAVHTVHLREQTREFVTRQDDGNTLPRLRPSDLLQPGKIGAKHVLVEENDRAKRLPMCCRRSTARGGEVGQKRFDFGSTHVPRVPHAVETNEPARPVDVRLLRPQAVVAIADTLAELIQKSRRTEWDLGAGMHGLLVLDIYPVMAAKSIAHRVSPRRRGGCY